MNVRPIHRIGIQNTTAIHCIHVAFKAIEMDISLDFGSGGSPTNGTLANSQKENVNVIVILWDDNPFVHDKINKFNNHFRM